MQGAVTAAELERWLSAQTCRCGARRFGAEPALAEEAGHLVLRIAGCMTCHEPTHLDVALPAPQQAAVSALLARLPVAPSRVIDPAVIRALTPFVESAFPEFGSHTAPDSIDLSSTSLGPDWQLVEWLRGSLGYGQARYIRRDGVRALATFTNRQSSPLAQVADKLRLPSPGIAPMLDLKQVGDRAVLLEAEPDGVPLATPMFPVATELALALGGRLLEIVADAANRGARLRGVRPELVYLDRELSVRVAPRAELLAGGMAESRDLAPEYPFEAIYQAPEVMQTETPSAASDVFSCCAVLLFAMTRRPPFAAPSPMHQIMRMMQGPPELPAGLDGRTAALVRAGLDPDPKHRPSARELANALLVA